MTPDEKKVETGNNQSRKKTAENIPSVWDLKTSGKFEEVDTAAGGGGEQKKKLRRRIRVLTPQEERNKKIAYEFSYFFAFLIFGYFLFITTFYAIHDWLALLVFSLVFITPAWTANAGMLVMGRNATRPIDGGRKFIDGRPLFGPGKTWRGFLLGPLVFGVPVGIGLNVIFFATWTAPMGILDTIRDAFANGRYAHFTSLSMLQPYFISCAPGQPMWFGFLVMLIRVFGVSYGAALGDLLGSFLKRRVNVGRGQPFWVVDQLDFVVVAVVMGLIPTFIWPQYIVFDPLIFIFILTLTPSVAVLGNTVAYVFGWKSVPW
ncbi:MAG: CDP-archaeol synthase [Promethearchaeota archaeon]